MSIKKNNEIRIFYKSHPVCFLFYFYLFFIFYFLFFIFYFLLFIFDEKRVFRGVWRFQGGRVWAKRENAMEMEMKNGDELNLLQ